MASHDPLDAAETAKHVDYRSSDQITDASRDLDDNYEFFKAGNEVDATDAEVKKVVRKIDLHIVPILFVLYFLQYLDKNAINFANTYGLKQGTNLQGQDFSWLGSIFYFGYLASQFPSGYLIQRLPVGRVVSVTVIIWGAIVCKCTSSLSASHLKEFHEQDDLRRYTSKALVLTLFNLDPSLQVICWYCDEPLLSRIDRSYCMNKLLNERGGQTNLGRLILRSF
jgi:hypothetical protein